MSRLVSFVLGFALSCSVAHAQINVVPVNGGTGSLVSIPIPGGSGLSVTVGTGSAALPLQEIKNNPAAVNITSGDDEFRNVPLGFDFPFYGKSFNNSWAMTNGLVTFQDPNRSGLGGACCDGVDLTTTTDARYNYTIFGLHSDLYSPNNNNQYYLRGTNEMTYGWYGVSQCCGPQGGNSFEIKINSLGLVDTRIAGAMISGSRVTSGMSGDLSKGEYYQYYHGSGLNITAGSSSIFSWQALGGTGAFDMCAANPLSSPTCVGYQTAYTTQQCTINALYDPSCPGYAAAYLTQQCSTNPLFSEQCPGYSAAYLEQQCSINPLYSTSCSGYTQAYHDQQCSLSALYATDCRGYAQAYLDQQCSINPMYSTTCRGYAAAYKSEQCLLNSLYATDCPNYATAFKAQQCSISALYATDCPGYAVAYKAQQCELNGLYDNTCPNYATAYATKMLLEQQGTASIVATAGVVAQNAPVVSTNNDGTISTTPSTTGSPAVDKAIAPPPPTANSAAAPAAAVQLVQAPPPPSAPLAPKNEGGDKKPEGGSSNQPQGQMAQAPQGGEKPAQPTARQALAERRQEAARAKAVESGKQLANEMGKAADMESQKAVQNVVIQAMGFTPGFDAYGKTVVPDVAGYRPFTVYNNQKTIDNRTTLRMFGGSDKLHQEMVDEQYNK